MNSLFGSIGTVCWPLRRHTEDGRAKPSQLRLAVIVLAEFRKMRATAFVLIDHKSLQLVRLVVHHRVHRQLRLVLSPQAIFQSFEQNTHAVPNHTWLPWDVSDRLIDCGCSGCVRDRWRLGGSNRQFLRWIYNHHHRGWVVGQSAVFH